MRRFAFVPHFGSLLPQCHELQTKLLGAHSRGISALPARRLRAAVQRRYVVATHATFHHPRTCRLPSRCSMRRASPRERSNATPRSWRSSTSWRSWRSGSPSTVSRKRFAGLAVRRHLRTYAGAGQASHLWRRRPQDHADGCSSMHRRSCASVAFIPRVHG